MDKRIKIKLTKKEIELLELCIAEEKLNLKKKIFNLNKKNEEFVVIDLDMENYLEQIEQLEQLQLKLLKR